MHAPSHLLHEHTLQPFAYVTKIKTSVQPIVESCQWDDGEEFTDQDGLVDIGKGNLYNTQKFNMLIVWFGLMICLGSTIYIGFISYQQISRQMRSYDPNS